MDVDEFIKATPIKRRKSALEPHLKDLLKLKSLGYSLADMAKYCLSKGLIIKEQSIWAYLRRQCNETKSKPIKPITEIKTAKQKSEEEAKALVNAPSPFIQKIVNKQNRKRDED
jgi:hypothetical protein